MGKKKRFFPEGQERGETQTSTNQERMSITTNEVFQEDHTAVITGAGSGIGRAAAFECASRGMHVWLVDVDENDLKQTKEDLRNKMANSYVNQKIQAIVANVCDEDNMKFVAKTVFKDKTTKSVHFLMNNAARSTGGGALATSMKDFNLMMKTNLNGPI